MSGHTRGPWFLAHNSLGTETFVMANGDDGKDWAVAKVFATLGNAEADAALIAAAPDLLAALKTAVSLWHLFNNEKPVGKRADQPIWIDDAEVAIDRAEGRQL